MQPPGRLVETQTEDGLRLHGFWQLGGEIASEAWTSHRDLLSAPSIESDARSGSFAWIVVHGVAGNFYNSSLLATVAETLLAVGHDVLRVNTRGRDPIAYFATPGGNARVGAAYEMIDDCRRDLAAWIALLRSLGYRRLGLLGHSLGAIKAAIAASQPQLEGLDGLICLSPPRLDPKVLANDPQYAARYREDLETAMEFVASGKPEALLSIRFPQPMLISAATYLDKYGRVDPFDYLNLARQIAMPCLWCFGDEEVRGTRASFHDCDKALLAAVDGTPNHSLFVISNADHAYSRARSELMSVLRRWIQEKI